MDSILTINEPADRRVDKCFIEIRKAWENAAKLINEKNKHMKTTFDKEATSRKINIGDLVLVLILPIPNKTKNRWKGPYRVLQATTTHCTLQNLISEKIINMNKNFIKKFREAKVLPFRKADEIIPKSRHVLHLDPNLEQEDSESDNDAPQKE